MHKPIYHAFDVEPGAQVWHAFSRDLTRDLTDRVSVCMYVCLSACPRQERKLLTRNWCCLTCQEYVIF